MAATSDQASVQVRMGLVGAGKGGAALLDLLLDWPGARVVVVVDPRSDAPALVKARALGIPTGSQHLDVYAYPVNLVLEVTGQPAVLEDLLKAKPPGVEVIGAASLRFFWDLVQDKVRATRQLVAQLDMAAALGSTLDFNQQIALIARKLAQACGVDRCTFYTWDETTELVIPMRSQFATGERDEGMWAAFKEQGKLKLEDVPFLYEVMERRSPIVIEEPASDSLVPRGWADLFEIRSLLVVPLLRKDRVVGACTLDYRRTPYRFTPEQIALAVAMSGQVSLALENARLYQDAADKAKRLTSLLETTKEIARVTDYSQLLSGIVQEAATFLKADGAGIRILEGTELVLVAHYGYSMEGFRQRVALGESASGWVVQNNRPLAVSDMERDPRVIHQHRAAFRREGFRAMLSVPMRIEDRTIGALFVVAKSPRQFSTTEIEVLSGFSGQAAIAINNTRLYQESEAGRKRLASLVEVAQRLTRGLDLPSVLDAISAAAAVVFEAEAGFRLVEGDELVRVEATPGARTVMLRERLRIGESLSGRVAETGEPFISADTAAEPRFIPEHRAAMDPQRTGAVMIVPIKLGERVLGTLHIFRERGYRFDEAALTLAMSLADQAAIAVENARLYGEAERRRKAAESLAELGRLISQSLAVEEVAQRIVDSVRTLLGTSTSALFRLEPESGDLVAVAVSGDTELTFGPNPVFPKGTGVAGLAVQERRPIVTPDLLTDPRITLTLELRTRIEQATFRSVLAVPLIIKDRVIGALATGDRAGQGFSSEEIQLAEAFANQAALALENARLFFEQARLLEETRRQHQEAVALGEVAREITSSLEREEVLQRIVERAREFCGSDLAFLAPYDQESRAARIIAASGARTELLTSVTITPGRGTGGRVLETGEAFITEDYLNDPRITRDYAEVAVREGFVAQAVVPLRVRGQTTGLLWVVNRTPRRFTPRDLTILTKLADQAAIALENSRLYSELRTALTEVETSQQRVVQAERLRALGEMAAGVAHDFNNLLAVILGRAELLLARVRDPDLVRGLEAIRSASLDGAQTVRRIQEFTRTRRTRPFGVVDLWQLLNDVVELTRPRWEAEAQSRGIAYEVRVDGGPVPPVSGIPEELREVFTNLLINALEAMPAGGRFVLRLKSQGDSVAVTAEDTGCGMSEETRRRVFEPFFTTKGPRGTGLGLSAAWGIVSRHGGAIEVESVFGAGSTFTVRLPVALEVPSKRQPAAPLKPRKGARVLVIDDEPAIREVVRDLLTAQGYVVIQAGDGAEGLARCEAEPLDLVLTDISMPGMSGWEVAAACWERFPKLPVGLITGWGDQLDPEQLVRHRIRFVLGKPFVASRVLREIASALEDAGTT